MKQAYVVAHFDKKGLVRPDLLALLELLSLQTASIVFVSTGLDDFHAELIGKWATVIRRQNFGYDFWSYKIGIDELGGAQDFDCLTLFNSSFFIADPEKLLRLAQQAFDRPCLRGVTLHNYPHAHVQSYWLSFGGGVCKENYFSDW